MNITTRHSLIACALALLLTPLVTIYAADFHVAPSGNDANPGTEDQSFATLERARDEIRRWKAAGPLPAGGITVELSGGVYELSRPFELTTQDSGARETSIV
jgi:hypothetical protein